ncbi:hypothetical protein Cantr_02402 [Candida viswanathii]|uniref:Uncharacterized protein n=1 Tax=Candida viswanathii TaxID=5486 RepID=A0A367YPC5_9ASCO|nr:hypothetical protein Cantr_02402 [Candida viswanathii]
MSSSTSSNVSNIGLRSVSIAAASSTSAIPRKISPTTEFSTITPSKTFQKVVLQNPTVLKIYTNLVQSGTVFVTSLYCLLLSLNASKVASKGTVFANTYNELFSTLAYVEEPLDIPKEEFSLILEMFNDLFNNFNFITLSQSRLRNKNLQREISQFFKNRQIIMDEKNDFMRETLSAALNDWLSNLKR